MLLFFEKKDPKVFQVWRLNFIEKMGQKKIIVDFFLLAFNSKLGHFDKNLDQVHIRVFLFRTFFFQICRNFSSTKLVIFLLSP
jgi:hypothetical protein